MRYLREDTAALVLIGPIVDYANGVTAKTSLTLSDLKCDLYKCEGSTVTRVADVSLTAQGQGTHDFVHVANGYWTLELTTTDTETAGQLIITLRDIDDNVIVPLWAEFTVLPQKVYDSLIAGTDNLEVETTAFATALDLTTTMKASVDAEVDEALATTTIGSPTAGSIADYINKLLKVAKNKTVVTSANGGTMTVYDTDDTTPLFTFKIYTTGDVRSTSNIMRRDREGQ